MKNQLSRTTKKVEKYLQAKERAKNGCSTLGEYFLFLLHAFYIFPFSPTPFQLQQAQTSNWYASLQIEPFISFICSFSSCNEDILRKDSYFFVHICFFY